MANANGMRKANEAYYSSKGKAIYSDFSTFAQGKALATANAIEFVRNFSGREGGIAVCEYGIGNGNFARVFLDELKKRDSALHSRVHYSLFDLSEKMISDAKGNLAAHKNQCSFTRFNAADELPSLPFDYCRINELLSDLPSELYARKGGSIPSTHPFVRAFLSRMDSGRQIPFPFIAEKFLLSLCKCGKPGFAIDIFDYGFYFADDILLLPVEEWNRVVARKYGSQITVDLNFLQLSAALAAHGFQAHVERQKEYCERQIGMPLELDDSGNKLDYLAKKKGDGISEDDGFFHLRIG